MTTNALSMTTNMLSMTTNTLLMTTNLLLLTVEMLFSKSLSLQDDYQTISFAHFIPFYG